MVKIWPKGDPEPGWLTTFTDTFGALANDPANGNADCTAGTGWLPGIAEQNNVSGWTHDSYNNFVVTKPRTVANAVIYDTIPSCLKAGTIAGNPGSGGAPTIGGAPSQIKWSFASLSNESGTLTWWGQVNCCDRITNTASITGSGTQGTVVIDSNSVYADPICPKLTSITKTASPTKVYIGDPFTFTIAYQNNGNYPIYGYQIWDTVPACVAVNSIANGGTQVGNLIIWNIGTLGASAVGSVSWVGHATCYPFNPYFLGREYFAYTEDLKNQLAQAYIKNYQN
jgi:uncharacterized repeat protein (TIGR01451 family)